MVDGWNKTVSVGRLVFLLETVPLSGGHIRSFSGRLCAKKTGYNQHHDYRQPSDFMEKMRCPWWNPCMFEPTQKAVTFFKPAAWIKHT